MPGMLCGLWTWVALCWKQVKASQAGQQVVSNARRLQALTTLELKVTPTNQI